MVGQLGSGKMYRKETSEGIISNRFREVGK